MTIKQRLEAAIAPWNLLEHPFYRAWNEGNLSVGALATYAAEYGSFIAGIDRGWERVGQSEHAAEEREHARLWEQFARALGTTIAEPQVPQVASLLSTSRRLFAEPATAWGALYAFEAQQPDTSATKLAGLDAHYRVADEGREYFEVHAGDYHEAGMIVSALEMADPEAVDRAAGAAGEMAVALWDALSGVLERHQ